MNPQCTTKKGISWLPYISRYILLSTLLKPKFWVLCLLQESGKSSCKRHHKKNVICPKQKNLGKPLYTSCSSYFLENLHKSGLLGNLDAKAELLQLLPLYLFALILLTCLTSWLHYTLFKSKKKLPLTGHGLFRIKHATLFLWLAGSNRDSVLKSQGGSGGKEQHNTRRGLPDLLQNTQINSSGKCLWLILSDVTLEKKNKEKLVTVKVTVSS